MKKTDIEKKHFTKLLVWTMVHQHGFNPIYQVNK